MDEKLTDHNLMSISLEIGLVQQHVIALLLRASFSDNTLPDVS